MSDNYITMETFQEGFKEVDNMFDASPANIAKPADAKIFKEVKTEESFNNSIFKNLPELLKFGCDILQDKTEKEVFLLGALGVVSGILPNIQGLYDGKIYNSNLFIYILANYGTGKGGLNFCREIGKYIHQQKKDAYIEAEQEWQQKMVEYHKDLKEFNKGSGIAPIEPNRVALKLLFIPANSSSTGMFELLGGNDGNAIIFETEGDTIANTLKTDYGNYSDGLRKAFHHEPISFYRRTNNELVDIERPSLSLVLSSTYDQLKNLIPTIENGLFSRFAFYNLKGNDEFRNVFSKKKSNYAEKFDELAKTFLTIHNNLKQLPEPVDVELTENQQTRFLETFKIWKNEMKEFVSEDLNGTVNRLGLICFRICMIFTALRAMEKNEMLDKNLTCQDVDFDNALQITTILKRNSINVFYKFPKDKKSLKTGKINPNIERAKKLLSEGMSYGKIAQELRTPKPTVYSWFNS